MEPPTKPSESDCCNSGCNPCILDVYEIQLKKYNNYIKANSKIEPKITNAIDLTSYTIFKLIDRKQVSKTCFLLKFTYADDKPKTPNVLEYTPGQYFLLKAKDYDGEFTRAYTPIPIDDDGLNFTILVRLYEIGRMSRFLKLLKIGQKTFWRGPYGEFLIDYNYRYLFFIAQGTGIAPIFSVINEMVQNEECETFIKLFFCCRDCDDILLREELYKLGSFWNFSYEIFLSNTDNVKRKYNEIIHENKLNLTHIKDYTQNKIGQLQTIICGSEKFCQNVQDYVENSGIERNNIYLF